MRYLLVDDEVSAQKDLERALRTVQPDCELVLFSNPVKALQYVQENEIDIAFLDVEMGSISGIVLAKLLKDRSPKLHIIFVTAYECYALEAFKLHATGYLLKPVTLDDLQTELTFIYKEPPETPKVRIQTFGGFDIFVNEEALQFRRSKSKELLAYLIDRQGSMVTNAEACAALWEDEGIANSKKGYLRVLITDIRKTLKLAGISDMFIKNFNSLSVRLELFDCDSYRFFDGDAKAINQYKQNYMPEYSWAEFTLGEMERRFQMIIDGE